LTKEKNHNCLGPLGKIASIEANGSYGKHVRIIKDWIVCLGWSPLAIKTTTDKKKKKYELNLQSTINTVPQNGISPTSIKRNFSTTPAEYNSQKKKKELEERNQPTTTSKYFSNHLHKTPLN
jgi:predicted ATP-grasp superfamily ATP-dependent carboligase